MSILAETAGGLLLAGGDIGFGHVKIDIDTPVGNLKFSLQSTVATGGPRNFKKWQENGKYDRTKTDLENQLNVMDVDIYNHQNQETIHRFLGPLAIKEGTDSRLCWDDDKSSDEDSISLLVGALAAAQTESVGGVDSKACVYVGTGLPLDKFFVHKENYEKNIKGKYTVTFKSGPWENVKCTLNIIKCRVYPQVWGIFIDMTLDQNGQAINTYLGKGNVLFLDPGFRTTDYALFRNGEMIDAYSGTLEFGAAWGYRQICNKLAENNIYLDEKLFDLYLNQSGVYEMADGRSIDLKPLGETAFKLLGKKISEELKVRLQEEWKSIHQTIVGGGGGAGSFKYLKIDNKELANNPKFGNASGFKKAVQGSIRKGIQNNG